MTDKVEFKVKTIESGSAKVFEVVGEYNDAMGDPQEWFVTSFTAQSEFREVDAEAKADTVCKALENAYNLGHNAGFVAGAKETRMVFDV